jgi:hypothetical protein
VTVKKIFPREERKIWWYLTISYIVNPQSNALKVDSGIWEFAGLR